jgi:hypothetical protein
MLSLMTPSSRTRADGISRRPVPPQLAAQSKGLSQERAGEENQRTEDRRQRTEERQSLRALEIRGRNFGTNSIEQGAKDRGQMTEDRWQRTA